MHSDSPVFQKFFFKNILNIFVHFIEHSLWNIGLQLAAFPNFPKSSTIYYYIQVGVCLRVCLEPWIPWQYNISIDDYKKTPLNLF